MTEKPIYLEPFINERGFMCLRDAESKRPVAFVDDLQVKNTSGDFQIATCSIVVDPTSIPENND